MNKNECMQLLPSISANSQKRAYVLKKKSECKFKLISQKNDMGRPHKKTSIPNTQTVKSPPQHLYVCMQTHMPIPSRSTTTHAPRMTTLGAKSGSKRVVAVSIVRLTRGHPAHTPLLVHVSAHAGGDSIIRARRSSASPTLCALGNGASRRDVWLTAARHMYIRR